MSNVKNPKLKNVQVKLQTLCKFYCIGYASSVALMQDVLQVIGIIARGIAHQIHPQISTTIHRGLPQNYPNAVTEQYYYHTDNH